MIEIPESFTLAQQLSRAVGGKVIRNVYTNTSPHGFAFFAGDPAGYHEVLSGQAVAGVKALAGQIEISFKKAKLLLMDDLSIRYFVAGEKLPEKHQLHIEFEDDSSIICTVKMYGGMSLFPDGESDNIYYIAAKEKPSPLTEAFDAAHFQSILSAAKPAISMKALLAAEQRIPGLGNGCLQDVLFNARLHPKRKLNTLNDADTARLFESVKQTLQAMTAGGGRDTEKDLFGVSGGYKTILSKKTVDYPCPACGGTIERQAYMGGNVYFCPVCQPL